MELGRIVQYLGVQLRISTVRDTKVQARMENNFLPIATQVSVQLHSPFDILWCLELPVVLFLWME